MYSDIARYILYPLSEAFLGTKMLKYLNELEETQWWSPGELQELQNEKLRGLIKHAYDNVPYYHRIFRERGLTDKDIRTVEDLLKLPILTKKDMRENLAELISKDIRERRAQLNSTAGSTGEPLKYYVDMDVTSIGWAGAFRGWGWAGYRLGDKRATLAGSSLVTDKPTFKERVRNMAERNLKLLAFDMSESVMALYAERLARYKPDYLRGYASTLYLFARYLGTKGVSSINPKAVFTTAEMLLPHYRKTIEKQFSCKVFDQYGCYDGGLQAMECPQHNGYHISSEKVIMAFIDEKGNPVPAGHAGEIIATDLHNYSMPFIRYAVGDRGTMSGRHCPCGRGLPLMKSIEGRATDFIITPEGKNIHRVFFDHIFEKMPCLVQFQVVQESRDMLTIKLVLPPETTQAQLAEESQKLLGLVQKQTGAMKISIEQLDKIPTTKAGKHKSIISRVT